MEFTGERVIPDKVPVDLYREHLTRYLFAKELSMSNKSVLDVGCGTGYGTYEMASSIYNIKVMGIDISDEAINYAKEHYRHKNLDFLKMDCTNLNFEQGTFDMVVSYEVIEHIKQVNDYLSEIKRVLNKEGVFIVSTPNKKMYSDVLPDYENPYHVKEYYLPEFRALLKQYYRYVDIYLQDYTQGIIIKSAHPDSLQNNYLKQLLLEKDTTDPEFSSFFIAVCSDKEIDTFPNDFFYPFAQSNILAEKDKYIDILKEEIRKRDESVRYIQMENKTKDEWILSLQEEVEKRDKATEYLKNQIQENEKWVRLLQEEVKKRDESVFHLKKEIQEKDSWIKILKDEIKKKVEIIMKYGKR